MRHRLSSVYRDGSHVESLRFPPYQTSPLDAVRMRGRRRNRSAVLGFLAGLVVGLLLGLGSCEGAYPTGDRYQNESAPLWDGETYGATLHSGKLAPTPAPVLSSPTGRGDSSSRRFRA